MTSGPLRLAFVSPRYPLGATVGGAEALLAGLASHARLLGHDVSFLTTCARDHYTWRNEHPAGTNVIEGVKVHFFPVNTNRDIAAFVRAQDMISRGGEVDADTERTWLRNNVNSDALCDFLRENSNDFDRIVAGPYLFGLIHSAASIAPDRTLLVPCLHDEVFAYLSCFREMFRSVRGLMFNTEPERDLAIRLYGIAGGGLHVVGMGLDPFSADPAVFASSRALPDPYLLYCGRREPMKGTPLLVDYFSAFAERSGRAIRLVLSGSGSVDVPSSARNLVFDAGYLSEQEKHEAMAGALAFVHPSVNESLSIVLLEAWTVGTPALVHAQSRVLVHQCSRSNGGLWFRSYPEFEESVCVMLDRPDIRGELGRRGREFVKREYTWDAVEKRLESALQSDPAGATMND